jgi:hypothetical protein
MVLVFVIAAVAQRVAFHIVAVLVVLDVIVEIT